MRTKKAGFIKLFIVLPLLYLMLTLGKDQPFVAGAIFFAIGYGSWFAVWVIQKLGRGY